MRSTPKGWQTGRFQEFVFLQRGFDLTKANSRPGDVPVISSSGVSYYHDTAKVDPPGLVTGRKGSLGKVWFVDVPYWPHDTTLWVKDFQGNDPYFVKVFLERLDLASFDAATSVPTLNRNNLHGLKISFPPLPEQQKIAAILSTWDRAIELTEKLIAAKQKRKQALMQQLLTGKVRFAEYGDRPWSEIKLGKLLSVRSEQIENDGTHPLYSLTIENGVTPKTERYNREFLVRDKTAKKYKIVYPGDIVFNPSNLRWGAIGIHRGAEPVLVSPIYEVLYVTNEDATDQAFLFQQLSSSRQIMLFAGMAEGTLVERTAVKLPTFLVCKVLVPPTKDEQSRVAGLLAATEREISIISLRRASLTQQKKGLMQQLLTGKVRVNVDSETVKG